MKSKFFRVARSGPTVDGRVITPAQIDEMAETYNPSTFGARIWCEHFRSLLPDGAFKAYGDVLAVKAETDAEGRRVLLAQVDATPDLLKLAADRQKVFWSIELDPDFTGTGKAYLSGLAITDSPASTGTEVLKFSLTKRAKEDDAPDRLYSEAFEAEGTIEAEAEGPKLYARVKALLAGRAKDDDERFAQMGESMLAIAEEVAAVKETVEGFADATKAEQDIKALRGDFDSLKSTLEKEDAAPKRKKSDGAPNSDKFTDC